MSPMVKGSKKITKKGISCQQFSNEKSGQLRRYIEKLRLCRKNFGKKVREIYYDKKIKQFMGQLLLKKKN